MNERLPTEEEWAAWLDQPETRALQAVARKRREDIKDVWENGGIGDGKENWIAIGGCKALQLLEDLDYEAVIESELKGD